MKTGAAFFLFGVFPFVLVSCAHKPPRPVVDSPPRVLEAPPLAIPANSQFAMPQQDAVFKVMVKSNGKPSKIELTQSTGVNAVDDLCRDKLRQYRFRPAYAGGKATAATTTITFSFQPNR